MKTKKLLGLVSAMIFSMTLLTGIAIASIIFLAGLAKKEHESSTILNDETGTTLLIQETVNNQESLDTVYLLDQMSNNLMRLNLSDGSSQNFDLGLGANTSINGRVFSSDGRWMAYCEVTMHEASNATSRLVVRDIEAGQNILEQDFGAIAACSPSAFSPDNQRIAVGMVINAPIATINAFPEEPNWALRIFDVNSGNLVQELNAESPNLPDLAAIGGQAFGGGEPLITQVLDYDNDGLYFLAGPYLSIGGMVGSNLAFRWDLANNTLSHIEDLSAQGANILGETGEIVFPYLNEAYPAPEPSGPLPLANELRLTDANGTRAIYRNSEETIMSTSFVNGGRQIAVLLISGPLGMGLPAPSNRYVLLNRDGTVEEPALENPGPMSATNDGFVASSIEQTEQGSVQKLLRYADGQLNLVWETAPSSPELWTIIWSSQEPIAENLTPFVGMN